MTLRVSLLQIQLQREACLKLRTDLFFFFFWQNQGQMDPNISGVPSWQDAKQGSKKSQAWPGKTANVYIGGNIIGMWHEVTPTCFFQAGSPPM